MSLTPSEFTSSPIETELPNPSPALKIAVKLPDIALIFVGDLNEITA